MKVVETTKQNQVIENEMAITKSAGTVARTVDLDYIEADAQFGVSR